MISISTGPHSSVCWGKRPAAAPAQCVKTDQKSFTSNKKVGMHTSSSTTTPFSVKDILKHHHAFGNEFLMTEQVVPMHHPHMHDTSRTRDLYDCQAELAGMQEKVDIHDSAAEEEINENGEKIHQTQISPSLYTQLVYGYLGLGLQPEWGLPPWQQGRNSSPSPENIFFTFKCLIFKNTNKYHERQFIY